MIYFYNAPPSDSTTDGRFVLLHTQSGSMAPLTHWRSYKPRTIFTQYDAYLLCDIDLPWAADEMREYPDEGPRIELFTIYKELLMNQKTPWGIVSGCGEQRTANAIQLIEQFL